MTAQSPPAPTRLAISIESPQTWLLTDPSTGQDVGGVRYHHNNHGNHYQPWLFRNSLRTDFGTPFPQLALAAQALEHEAREGGK